jgi:hypothetical protein
MAVANGWKLATTWGSAKATQHIAAQAWPHFSVLVFEVWPGSQQG